MLGQPVQIAYAVDDIHEAARTWEDRGAGPFLVREHIEITDCRVDGQPGTFDHSAAYGQWGDVMLELIVVHEPQPVANGLHHLAFFVDDLAVASAELTRRGWPESLWARTPGGTAFAHHDAASDLGHAVEIYERTEGMIGLYKRVAALANPEIEAPQPHQM